MQPSTQPERQTGSPGGYARPTYEPPPPAVSITRARPWWVALAGALTMLVLIAAIDNPPATRSLLDQVDYQSFSGRMRGAISTFGWNFGDLSNDFGHAELANLLMDVAVIVLVFLFVAVISRGSGSFWRTLLGTWIAVIAACVFAGYVRSSVLDAAFANPSGHGKATAIFFSVSSPGASLMFAAVTFGLVVAIIAAAVAVLTRRDEVLTAPAPYSPAPYSSTSYSSASGDGEPAAAASPREPWSAPPAAVPGPVATPSPWTNESTSTDTDDDDADRTTQLPAVDSPTRSDSGDDHTRELPRTEGEP